MEQPSRNRDPVGRVLRVLPESGGADTAIELAIASHGLSHEFPEEVLREADKYGREVQGALPAGREDLRKLPLITIDGEDARDFDDAITEDAIAAGREVASALQGAAATRTRNTRDGRAVVISAAALPQDSRAAS